MAYDITFHLSFDATFTPAVISAINRLSVSSFQIRSDGPIIGAEITNRVVGLGNATQGPFTSSILFDDLDPLANGFGYNFSVSKSLLTILLLIMADKPQ